MDELFGATQTQTSNDIFSGGGSMGDLMRTIDWGQTPLGPTTQWPQSLRTALSICLASRFPMLLWWGPELVMLYNDAYRPILGATKHPRSMGQRGRECWPEIWDVIGSMLESVLSKGQATWSTNQLLLLDRNGYVEECYFTFSYSPIRDETGNVGGVFTAVTETTDAVIGERRLRTLRELAAHSSEAQTVEEACRIAASTLEMNTADLPFALLYALNNDGTEATLEATMGLVPGTPASPQHIRLTEQDDEEIQWPLVQVISTQQTVRVDNVTERFGSLSTQLRLDSLRSALVLPIVKSGQESLYGILVAGVSPRLDLDDDYRSFFELVAGQVATNIAHARAYQEERARAEVLEALDRAKTAFFSNISHEFRTPLTLLLGPTQDALHDDTQPLPERQRKRLEIVHRNGLRLLKLVNTLLDFSRIEAGRVQAVFEPTDLATFTAELASTFRSVIEQAGMQLIVDCPPLSELAYVEREMWEKIVLNLLSNAFKFTFQGQITVTLYQVGQRVELRVQDTGVGIASQDLPHIFDRFHRVRGTRARTFEGSGIGLSLVQELVQQHKGTIQVESRVGEGTTFSISLPLGSAHLPTEHSKTIDTSLTSTPVVRQADAYREEALRWLPTTQKLPSSLDVIDDLSTMMPNSVQAQLATIMLVDDNADMRNYVTHLLQHYYTVKAVADGANALQEIQETQPDLILSDIMMPNLDGFQLLHALRADPRTSGIPIILLSARAGEEAMVEGLAAGADDYLTKPFSARELLARMSTRLELARMRTNITQQKQEHTRRLQQLADASLTINSILSLEDVLNIITAQAREIIGAHEAVIGLTVDHSWAQSIQAISLSEKYAHWQHYHSRPDGSGIYSLVCRTNQPLRLTQEELVAHPSWQGFGKEALQHPPLRGLLVAPLTTRDGQNQGLIQLSDKYEGEFTEEDEATLVQLAQMASIAIENAQLYQQTRDDVLAREHLLSMVSHDLKNPLSAIKGYAQLLQRSLEQTTPSLNERTTLTLERINTTVVRMTNLINELLDLARLQAGQPLELNLQSVDLVALIQQGVAEQQQTTQKKIHVHTTIPTMRGQFDAPRLERVIANLLSNAIKYSSDANDIDVHIGCKVEGEVCTAVIAVRDYGIGIPQQDIPHIFEQFHRAHNVMGTIKGTGVGLASAYEITRLHNGTITVESTEGAGSTFTVHLPLIP